LEWKNRREWKKRDQFWQLAWPYTKLWAVVYVLVILAWSVSAAKHFGNYDAKRVLSDPAKYLSRVKLHYSSNAPPPCLANSTDRLFMMKGLACRIPSFLQMVLRWPLFSEHTAIHVARLAKPWNVFPFLEISSPLPASM